MNWIIFLTLCTISSLTAVPLSKEVTPKVKDKVLVNSCTCGRWGVRSDEGQDGFRIVGGTIAAPNSIPYQVGLWKLNSRAPFCGGTLISPNYILTAAHCTIGKTAKELKVAVGDTRFDVMGDGEKFINVAAIILHPDYNSNTFNNDFSLLRLASTASVSTKVGIACLPKDPTQTFAGAALKISGWGTTSSGGQQSSNLLYANVLAMTNSACAGAYGSSAITANMICATADNYSKDTCQGDSGGPMVASIDNKITLVGVTSWGYGCAQAPYPGIYARVTAQKAWILANSDSGRCQN